MHPDSNEMNVMVDVSIKTNRVAQRKIEIVVTSKKGQPIDRPLRR